MASKALQSAVALLAVMMVLAASADVAYGICNISNAGLGACKPAAAVRNPTDGPSAECCNALKGADLACLCGYKNSSLLRVYGIDVKRALTLPGKCGLSMPNC